MQNVKAESTSQPLTLPDDIIVENILPRLPAKSLIRFKFVCKRWLSTISSPKFAKLQLKLSSFCPRFLFNTLVNDNNAEPSIRDRLYTLELLPNDETCNNNVKDLVPLDFEFAYGRHSTLIRLVGSYNGLLCLYVKGSGLYTKYFCLWNPTIHEHRTIRILNDGTFSCVDGFGYVSSLDDYKTVALFESTFHQFMDLYVFTYSTGLWTRIADQDDHYKLIRHAIKGSLIGDTMYFIADIDKWRSAKRIVGVNLVTEQFEHIPWMDWLETCASAKLFEMEGCLSMQCCLPQYNVHDVWMLKKFGDWNSWEKLFSIYVRHWIHFCYFPEIRMCLVQNYNKRLRLIDPSRDTQEQLQGIVDSEEIVFLVKSSDGRHELYLLNYDGCNNNVKNFVLLDIQVAYGRPNISLPHLVGSYNGLVCLYNREYNFFHISNPAIRQHWKSVYQMIMIMLFFMGEIMYQTLMTIR